MNDSSPRAGLAIFSSREDPASLTTTVRAAMTAAAGHCAVVDVLVNGNQQLATAMQPIIETLAGQGRASTVLRLWFVPMGDKSHTWNEYLERISPDADCFFVDGYARLDAGAIAQLQSTLQARPQALAVTGVPTVGLSARRFAADVGQHGGIHGNCYGLTQRTRAQLRALGFRLPLGAYRTDPTLGAALAFGLDLAPRQWRPLENIAVCPNAHWTIRGLRWWHPADLRTHLQRVRRQAQGELENAAVRHRYYVKSAHFGSLPRTAAQLVREWADEAPSEFQGLLQRGRHFREAFERMTGPRDWSLTEQVPRLLFGPTALTPTTTT